MSFLNHFRKSLFEGTCVNAFFAITFEYHVFSITFENLFFQTLFKITCSITFGKLNNAMAKIDYTKYESKVIFEK